MDDLKKADFEQAHSGNYGPIIEIFKRTAIITVATGIQIFLYLDLIIQRLANVFGTSRLSAGSRPSQRLRNINRIAACAITLFIVLCTQLYKHAVIRLSVEVPILGPRQSELNLYYPPIGTQHLPKLPVYNLPPKYRPRTPLFIPFTRNSTMMRQAVLSYISAGWPRADIVIIDNSGTMDANNRHLLSESNPFFLDYDLFRRRYGVSILQTPTLLNFAQLQNFLLRVAVTRDWPYYFWSHMDVVVMSAEEILPYKPFYHRVLDIVDAVRISASDIITSGSDDEDAETSGLPSYDQKEVFMGSFDRKEQSDPDYQAKKKLRKRSIGKDKWAVKFFNFDNLALINVAAWREIGQWDVFIPYYTTDCDAYSRMVLAGYRRDDVQAGHMFDIADVISNPEERFFPGPNRKSRDKWGIGPEGSEPEGGRLNSWRYRWLKSELLELMELKLANKVGRNTWQGASAAAAERKPSEPWSYDTKGFQAAWWATADAGRETYIKKWGTMECQLNVENQTLKDAWLSEYLQEGTEEWETRKQSENYWLTLLSEGPIR